MTTLPLAEISLQLSDALVVLERNLAGNLQDIYLFGSAIDEGLKPFSDIDLLITVNTSLDESVRRSLANDLLSVSAWPGTSDIYRALEVTVIVLEEVMPWQYPPKRELQFGEWLRNDLERGNVPPPTFDPDLTILLTQVTRKSLCLSGRPAAEVFDKVPEKDFAQALLAATAQWNGASDWQGDERNVILGLARIWFSARTGRIVSKNAAATWALRHLPTQYRPVLAAAQEAYRGIVEDDLAHRTDEVAAFVQYVKALIESA